MIIKSFKKLAGVSAIALTVSLSGGAAYAQVSYNNTPINTAVEAPVSITVDNAFDVEMTPAAFGTIGVVPSATDRAELRLQPDGTLTDDTTAGATNARIVSDNATATPITVELTSALIAQTVFVTYSTLVPLTNTGSTLNIDTIEDDLTSPGGATDTDADGIADDFTDIGSDVTDGSGELTFNVGLTLSTVETATAYPTGTYTGGISVIISY